MQIMAFDRHNISLQCDTNPQDSQNFVSLLCHKRAEQSEKQRNVSDVSIHSYFTSTPNMYLSNIAPPNVCPPTSLTANVTLYAPVK